MTNPAIDAANAAQAQIDGCLDAGQSFRLEAGAGAGKTYSLVLALKKLIAERGRLLQLAGQKVACITYTEVGREEIATEIEQHPAILVETIHAFSWRFMGQFQKELRALVAGLADRQDRIAEAGGVAAQRVDYDLGFFSVDQDRITLGHDDVPRFMARLMDNAKFRALLTAQFPIIFIDEYQDTDPHFMAAITGHFLSTGNGPRVGLFGDHWQTIYRSDYALADIPGVEPIDKGSNFRSVPAVVNVLNALRPELPQAVVDPDAVGEARFFHANSFVGERTSSAASKNDTPPEVGKAFVTALLVRLGDEGWNLSPGCTKILMLTHNAIAGEQGYAAVAKAFRYNDAFAKKDDPAIAFFIDTLEPVCRAYADRQFGEMFRLLGSRPEIQAHADKLAWGRDLANLSEARRTGSVGDVIDLLKRTRRPRLPDRIQKREQELADAQEGAELRRSLMEHRQLRAVPYAEITSLSAFIEGRTPFATQHSVKGAEFENVVVILGGGWNHYNWPQLLELLETGALTPKNQAGFHRARNLFYVAVSRPKRRLAVLATQTLSTTALAAARRLFGEANVIGLEI